MADPLVVAIAERHYPRARSYWRLGDYIGFNKNGKIAWWLLGKRGATFKFHLRKGDPSFFDARQYYVRR